MVYYMQEASFEWDDGKEQANFDKHGVKFIDAQKAFYDRNCIILEDCEHSEVEQRYFCLGKVQDEVMTVRFTYRKGKVRIIGAGFWRKGRKIYEKEKNKIH